MMGVHPMVSSGRPEGASTVAPAARRPGPRSGPTPGTELLQSHRRMLAVVAHPDDESFGLGAVLSAATQAGSAVSLLCFTHGEASTLHAVAGDLGRIRARELHGAAHALGVTAVQLLSHPDGGLSDVPLDMLASQVTALIDEVTPDLLLAFDEGGITGHPDHERATEAARRAARLRGLTVAAWAIPADIAQTLNREFGTGFVGRPRAELDVEVHVDRACQWQAIGRHRSQSLYDMVLRRRLELLADREWLRFLDVG
jgi:LmbE family N-acetylglucosaminyl deacetylase